MILSIHELRPHLGALNWALKRINKSIEVITDQGAVVDLKIGEAHEWLAICGNQECGKDFKAPNTEFVYCPYCGHDNLGYIFE